MFSRHLRCHGCDARLQYTKGTGITRAQCPTCDYLNFFDEHGDITDPPADLVAEPVSQSQRIAASKHHSTPPLSSQKFESCQTCQHNQLMCYNLLSKYLPAEDDPQRAVFEQGLEKYKQDVHRRYPIICTNCAQNAQMAIHDADYASLTSNLSQRIEREREGRRGASPAASRSRDTGTKMMARLGLFLVRNLLRLSVAYQIFWHSYSLLGIYQDMVSPMFKSFTAADWVDYGTVTVKPSQCLEELENLRFNYACARQSAVHIPAAILLALCFLWYNPGLPKLFHPAIRIACVKGWKSHFIISTLVLAVRWIAYSQLVEALAAGMSPKHALVSHAVAIAFILAGSYAAHQSIQVEKWRVSGSIMPRPEDRDVLGKIAGPPLEHFTPQPSSTRPTQLLSLDTNQRFPISNLAPQHSSPRDSIRLPPSPPRSEGDPMDIEPIAPSQAPSLIFQSSSPARYTGWESVRTNLFGIEDEMRAKQEQARRASTSDKYSYIRPNAHLTPFRGRLPAAPMSQERRLRNPVSQVPRFKERPSSDRPGFFQTLRTNIDRGIKMTQNAEIDDTDRSESASPVKSRLNLAASDWHLPSDSNAATGIEDMFGGGLRIDDGPPQSNVAVSQSMAQIYLCGIGAAVFVGVLAFSLDLFDIRRSVCLFLIKQLERLGY